MPTEKPRSRLVWRGRKTVQEIVNRLHERERILLVLPAGFHHAVSVHLVGDVRRTVRPMSRALTQHSKGLHALKGCASSQSCVSRWHALECPRGCARLRRRFFSSPGTLRHGGGGIIFAVLRPLLLELLSHSPLGIEPSE